MGLLKIIISKKNARYPESAGYRKPVPSSLSPIIICFSP